MFSHLDLGQWIIIGLSVLLLIWFFFASIYNRQRGLATYRWLRRGLGQFGEISHAEWMGSAGTGGRLAVDHAARPFRKLEAAYLLETREILPYWIFTRLRGRRDVVTIRANLRVRPQVELVAGRKDRAARVDPASGEGENRYAPMEAPAGFFALRGGEMDEALEKSTAVLLAGASSGLQRLSLQKTEPHLTIQARAARLVETPAEEFFRNIGDWLQSLG